MDIESITKALCENGIIDSMEVEYKPFSGGTVSTIGLLSDGDGTQLVLKSNAPIVEMEAYFLEVYKEADILPRLIYVDPQYDYLVYSFMEGSTDRTGMDKSDALVNLVTKLINYYKKDSQAKGWGWADEPSGTWKEFLSIRYEEMKERLTSVLQEEDANLVQRLIEKTEVLDTPYLLHGDCGIHNFIFSEGKLTGIIDPTPVFGDPVYDLVYAFCSSPDGLTRETIEKAASQLTVANCDSEKLVGQVLIGLYFRIATCLKHHPEDLEQYLVAWQYWKDLASSGVKG